MSSQHLPRRSPDAATTQRSDVATTSPVAVLLLSVVAALVPAIAVGWIVGSFAARSQTCEPSEKWCDLNELLAGAFTGGAVGLAVYVAVGVILIRRRLTKGHRAGVVMLHLLAPLVLASGWFLLLAVGEAVSG